MLNITTTTEVRHVSKEESHLRAMGILERERKRARDEAFAEAAAVARSYDGAVMCCNTARNIADAIDSHAEASGGSARQG